MAYQNRYGTARMVSGGGDFSNYSSSGPLARSMATRGVPIGAVTDPMAGLQTARAGELNPNLVTPSTLPTQVQQPMRNLDFGAPPPPAPPPTSDVRTQTGQGGATSTIPGASAGQPTQQGGTGGAQMIPGTNTPAQPGTEYVNPMMHAQAVRQNQVANSGYAKSAASDTIRQHQIAMGLVRPDGSSAAGDNYNSWLKAGQPLTNAQGQMLDTRGQVMTPDAWNVGVMAGQHPAYTNMTNQYGKGAPQGLNAPWVDPRLVPKP